MNESSRLLGWHLLCSRGGPHSVDSFAFRDDFSTRPGKIVGARTIRAGHVELTWL